MAGSGSGVVGLFRRAVALPQVVRSVHVTYAKTGAGQAGARFFLRDHVPLLQLGSQHVDFAATKLPSSSDLPESTPHVLLTYTDDTAESLAVEPGQRGEDIAANVMKAVQTKDPSFVPSEQGIPEPPTDPIEQHASLVGRNVKARARELYQLGQAD